MENKCQAGLFMKSQNIFYHPQLRRGVADGPQAEPTPGRLPDFTSHSGGQRPACGNLKEVFGFHITHH